MNNTEVIVATGIVYTFLVATVVKLGSYKKCGGMRAFLVGFFLTPVIGFVYVALSPLKSVIKIVHYHCSHCGLDFTTFETNCPSCAKDGERHRLHKVSMRSY